MVDDETDASESMRYKHRYLDLRRPSYRKHYYQAQGGQGIREYLDSKGFLEIETPMLTKSTPEGARTILYRAERTPDIFLPCPSPPRYSNRSLWYPGLEKYYQIVKCFRDET